MSYIEVSPLQEKYYEVAEYYANQTNYEILDNDVTEIFWEELKDRVQNEGLITIGCFGETRSGKSTAAIQIAYNINKFVKEFGLNDKVKAFPRVFSDQTEFLRGAMKEALKEQCVTIDEDSKMSGTGFNSSTEMAAFTSYNEMFAVDHLHRIFCTPHFHSEYLRHSTIALQVIGKNLDDKETICKVFYVDPNNPMSTNSNLALGVVKIYVGDLIDNEDYEKYKKKKQARLDLLQKHGVRDIRELETSELTVKIYERLQDKKISNKQALGSFVRLAVKNILQEEKLFYSIIGSTELQQNVNGLLGAKVDTYKLEKKMRQTLNGRKNSEIKEAEWEELRQEKEELENEIESALEKERNNVKILEEYYNIK